MSGMSGKSPRCILCGALLGITGVEGILLHPSAAHCRAVLTDEKGVSVDDQYELIAGEIFERQDAPEPDPDVLMIFEQFTPAERALLAIFDHYKVPRLGGASGDKGWSSFSTYQKCPYLWKKTYIDHRRADEEELGIEPFGRAVGSVVHTMLAVHYQKKIDKRYPITPEIIREYLHANGCNPEITVESWRLFAPYRLFYKHEFIKPLATEFHLVDPHTGQSTRYDLICEVLPGYEGREPGTYICDHKTAQRFDDATLFGWVNDGTIIQQATLWKRLGMDLRFGTLTGIIVNLIGKQKVPELHRTFVAPNRWQMDQQTHDLKIWNAQRKLAIVTDTFPRARQSCLGRYGKCDLFEHCATGEG